MRRQDVKSRSGVALIIVLGLVAILMIVCVSFTINMRVERAGAANLRHGTVATQIVKGALASAIATIDDEIEDRSVPAWYNTNDFDVAYYVDTYKDNNKTKQAYYWNGTIASRNGENADERLPASFFSAEVEKYFPPGMAYKGFATKYFRDGTTTGGTSIKQPEWIPVYADKATEKDDDNKDKKRSSSGAGKEVVGRYAFIAMDTSGLLDASRVSRTVRWMGRDPREIQALPEQFASEFGFNPAKDKTGGREYTQAVKNAKDFMKNLKNDGRYESFAEFRAMNEADGINITNCSSFNTFSFDPVPSIDDEKIDISTLQSIKANKKKIIEAFYDCGLTGGEKFGSKDCEQARWAYLGLVDYVDEDSEMEDDDKIHPWQRPATEDMPLMSGFIAKLTFQRRERAVKKTNAETGAEYWEKDTKQCEYRISGDFKIPFTRLQRGRYDLKSGLSVEGKVRFGEWRMNGDASASFGKMVRDLAKKVVNGSGKPEDNHGDVSLSNLKIESCAEGDEWTVVENKADNTPLPLDGFRIYVMAEGATVYKHDAQHRYPLRADHYNDSEEGSWMTVPFDCAQNNFEFEDGDASTFVKGKNAAGADLELKKWEKSVVVWAEFLDPRFACMEMEDDDSPDMNHFDAISTLLRYHVSHSDVDDIDGRSGGRGSRTIPVTMFKDYSATKDAFGDLNVTVKPEDFDGDREYGGYFSRRGTRPGASPIAWYMLEHPYVSREFYKINVDGIQVSKHDRANTTSTTDGGSEKWRTFVKNGPLESVGELGYLPIGPWFTIRLYDYDNEFEVNDSSETTFGFLNTFARLPGEANAECAKDGYEGFHPVLNYFTVTNAVGRVNINTAGENVLSAVFCSMPFGVGESYDYLRAEQIKKGGKGLEEYLKTLPCIEEPEDAKSLAKALINCRQEEEFTSLADLGFIFAEGGSTLFGEDRGLAADVVANAFGDDYGEFEREDVIRNSCGLFTTRGQSFVIAVRGESYSPMYGRESSMEGGSVNAAKTAVAQIWRDTERPADIGSGKNARKTPHPIFVQFFKILDD